jgi:hypothetical protein
MVGPLDKKTVNSPEYYGEGSRKQSILHARLRHQCSSLNSDLYRMNITNHPKCQCESTSWCWIVFTKVTIPLSGRKLKTWHKVFPPSPSQTYIYKVLSVIYQCLHKDTQPFSPTILCYTVKVFKWGYNLLHMEC